MPKPLPILDSSLLLPPVSPEQYTYFENAAGHPFDADAEQPCLLNAWWLAECSLAAYAEEGVAAKVFQMGGLRIVDTIRGDHYGGQCYVLADDEKIILAFRGTQTVKREHLSNRDALREQVKKVLRDVGTDAKARQVSWTGRSGGKVHCGFADSCNELLPIISQRVNALRAENPQRCLWLTGHSLGAALAVLVSDCMDDVQGMHVFGSPQVGNSDFASNLKLSGWRFRHHADIISWAPSRLLGYVHVQPSVYFDRDGIVQEEPSNAGLLADWWQGIAGNAVDAWNSLLEGSLAGLAPEAFNDHAPLFYTVLTWNAYEAQPGHLFNHAEP